MLKIQIIALPKPNKKITGHGIDHIEPSMTPREIIANIIEAYPDLKLQADGDLIIDKTASIPRLAVNDPVNEYFNGHTGDIYRIVDDSSTRFRMVSGTAVRNKTKTSPFHDVTDTMYYSAYNTVLDMLKDRRRGAEVDEEVDSLLIKPEDMTELFAEGQLAPLNIMGVQNRRGRYMYVFFLPKDDETMVSRKRSAGAKGPVKALVATLMKTVIDDYNKKTSDKLTAPTEERGSSQNFLDKIEMIIVCNNQHNDNLVKHELPIQVFSVQQLVFNVTKHMDQPSFYILDPTEDRTEILDVLSLNGLVLEKDKPIADFNIKDGTKLILI